MLQGQKLQITNQGTLSRDEKIRRDFKKKYSKGAKNKIKINIWEKGKRQKEKEVEGEKQKFKSLELLKKENYFHSSILLTSLTIKYETRINFHTGNVSQK